MSLCPYLMQLINSLTDGLTTDDVNYEWRLPMSMIKAPTIYNFKLMGDPEMITSNSTTRTGTYSYLVAYFPLQRIISTYLLQMYIPTTNLLIVSWMAFWMKRGSKIRIYVVLASLLMMAFGISAFNRTIPQPGYTRAIDIWNGILLTFVFGNLLQQVAIDYRIRTHKSKVKEKDVEENQNEEKNHKDASVVEPLMMDENQEKELTAGQKKRKKYIEMAKHSLRTPEKVDQMSRIAYPVMFAIFAILYFVYYLISS